MQTEGIKKRLFFFIFLRFILLFGRIFLTIFGMMFLRNGKFCSD